VRGEKLFGLDRANVVIGLLIGLLTIGGYIAKIVHDYTATSTTLQVRQMAILEHQKAQDEQIKAQWQAIRESQMNSTKMLQTIADMHRR
jgi:hypothetical protein